MGLLSQFSKGALSGFRVGRTGIAPNTAVWLYRLGDTLVDSGAANQASVVTRIASLGDVRPAKAVVTHHHEDHAGGCAALAALTIPTYAPSTSLSLIHSGFHIEYYRWVVWGSMLPCPGTRSYEDVPGARSLGEGRIDIPVEGGPGVGPLTLRALPTPGHCPDHHVLLCPELGVLFSADMYVTRRPEIMRFDQDPLQEMHSLREVLREDFTTVCCAHKGVVHDGRQALEDRLQFLLDLQGRAVHMRDQGHDVSAITRQLLGPASAFEVLTRFDFSKRHTVEKLLHMRSER